MIHALARFSASLISLLTQHYLLQATQTNKLTSRKRAEDSTHLYRYHRVELWLMLAPFLIGILLLIGLPMIFTIALAFMEFDALSAPVWRGLQNFVDIANRDLFWIAFRNSALFIILAVPLRLLGALLIALLLNQKYRGIQIYRSAIYLPTIFPEVAYAFIWMWIFNPLYGPLNKLLELMGLPQFAWLAGQETALISIVIMSLFQIGEGFVLLLAGLQDIPTEYYDSAVVNGANRWQRFRLITLPMLMPWVLLLTIRDVLLSAQNTFAPAYLMTNGGPYYATYFVPLFVFEEAFDRFRFGTASATMVVLFLIVGTLLYLIYRLVGGWGYADDV